MRKGSYVEPSKMTLAAYLTDEWLPSITGNVRPATYATYSSLVRKHIVTRPLGQHRLQAITPAQVKLFYAELKDDAGLKPESRRPMHSVLHKALADAVSEDRLVRNPIDRVQRPAADETRRATAWSERELRRFLVQAKLDRLHALWRLAAMTGMRRGECLGLTWRLLDLDTGDDLVFCTELGAPIPPVWVSERFLQLRKAAGIPVGSMHILRHTAATLMLIDRHRLHVVAARLGDRPETVLRVYAHLLPKSDAAAAEGMERLVAGDEAGSVSTRLANGAETRIPPDPVSKK
jgi:integrase